MTLRSVPPGSMLKPPLEKRERRKTPVQKRPGKDPDYLTMVRELPCCVCLLEWTKRLTPATPVQCHHLKSAGGRGTALRNADKNVLPLCLLHHDLVERVGSRNEVKWFKDRGIDCLTLAASLYANKHSLDAMRRVLAGH